MKYITFVLVAFFMFTGIAQAKPKFTTKKFDAIEIGMSLSDVKEKLGQKVHVHPHMTGEMVKQYILTTYLEESSFDQNKTYLVLTYRHNKMAMWSRKVKMTTASIIIEDDKVVSKHSKTVSH